MNPTRGNNSPKWKSTLATTRRAKNALQNGKTYAQFRNGGVSSFIYESDIVDGLLVDEILGQFRTVVMGLSQLQIGDGSGQGKASDVRIVDQDVETVRAKIVSNSNRLECDPIHPQMYSPHLGGVYCRF
jgi:hypothetical protein